MNIKKNKSTNEIKFCFNFPWRNLHPGTQNTLIGGLLISQQFESLVKIDSNGNVTPSIASKWEISEDFKTIDFYIDSNKKFQNGNSIKSEDVLASWNRSLKMSPEGPNNSLRDVLYKLKGSEKGKDLKLTEGFKIYDDNHFSITFNEPFRLAIYYLRGARFAIYQEINDTIIGSGRYSFDINNNNESLFVKDLLGSNNIVVNSNPPGQDIQLISNNKCDVLYAPQGSSLEELKSFDYIDHVESGDAIHLALTLNTKNGIFTDPRMRKAFQYLIFSNTNISDAFVGNNPLNRADPQIYNLFSQGRLDPEEAYSIINEGKIWLNEFEEKISKSNLTFLINNPDFLKKAFSLSNIEKSVLTTKENSEYITKVTYNGSLQQDFTGGFISVLSYDPDGIYHALGRNGAILNPYMANEKLFDLLETGREITDRSKIDDHYKEVSRTFLREVPFIHLGFSKNVLIYNKNKVKIGKDSFRNSLDFSSIEAL